VGEAPKQHHPTPLRKLDPLSNSSENGLHPLTDQRARAPHMRVKLLLQDDDVKSSSPTAPHGARAWQHNECQLKRTASAYRIEKDFQGNRFKNPVITVYNIYR